MKKILIALITLFSIISSAANAKTQGNYIGLNLINTEVELFSITTEHNERPKEFDSYSKTTSFSGGLNYKYAFNFNKFFVAPEIFFDFNKAKGRAKYSDQDNVTYYNTEIKNSVGAKLNLGYDITDKFALSGFFGHSINRVRYNYTYLNDIFENNLNYKTREAFIYGLGLKYDLTKRFSLNASYEIVQFGLSNDVFNTTDKINPDFSVAKLGLAYNF